MSKTVFFLRHAKSDWADAGCADHERPLNARGRSAAPKIGRWLNEHNIHVEKVISSTALRAKTTAQLVANQLKLAESQVELTEQLYLTEPDRYLDVIMNLSQNEQVVMIVGHNPTISDVVSRLCEQTIEMPTSALVQVDLQLESFQNLNWKTAAVAVNIILPRQLEA